MQTVWIFPNWPLYQSPVKSKYGTLQWLFHTTYSAPTPILIKIVWDMIQDQRFSLLRFNLGCGAINRHLTHEQVKDLACSYFSSLRNKLNCCHSSCTIYCGCYSEIRVNNSHMFRLTPPQGESGAPFAPRRHHHLRPLSFLFGKKEKRLISRYNCSLDLVHLGNFA